MYTEYSYNIILTTKIVLKLETTTKKVFVKIIVS